MRAGGCTVQQSLTAEAASVVKQAETLARRRGHAQVTPLHVANTMLSASTGLLRTACLQSHSHPLQCKALELCFNVALNRLPASSSSPMLGPHSQHPSLSNALVAALKRAQAHQRRGSIENQQQPLLAVKIEFEQLIISILDDPSVSRVMREAGFSSTQVKSNIEKSVSLEPCSQTPTQSSKRKKSNLLGPTQPPIPTNQIGIKVRKLRSSDQVKNEDVMSVVHSLTHKRRKSPVIVGECLATIESVVGTVMDKVEKGEVPENLKEVKFISLPLFSVEHLPREDVQVKLGDLRGLVKSLAEKGVVLYLGDLKWITEYRATSGGKGNCYCPVEHMILELGRLVGAYRESGKCKFMGIATFNTYMRCRTGHPSLAVLWDLQPTTVPAGSLCLRLIPDSEEQSESKSKNTGNSSSQLMLDGGNEKQLTCCADCSAKFEIEARNLENISCNIVPKSSSLLSWLKENGRIQFSDDQDCVSVSNLRKKWNSICISEHKQTQSSGGALTFLSVSPSSSCFSYDHRKHWNSHQTLKMWPEQSWKDNLFANSAPEPDLRIYFDDHRDARQALSSNPISTPQLASPGDVMEMEYVRKFKEFNAENLNALCNVLEEKVPWQKEIIPEIVGTILQCRSGMLRRKDKLRGVEAKEETWLLFQGVDDQAKEKIARELAKEVFGSHSKFVLISLSCYSSTRPDSMDDLKNKRCRDEQSSSYIKRFADALSINPHRVFLAEDVEQADYSSQMGIKRAIDRGKLTNLNGEEVSLSDAIIILSCENFSSRSRASSPPINQKSDASEGIKTVCMDETAPSSLLDLNTSFDYDGAEDQSIDNITLLESVDRRIIFKIQAL